jgi:hypothetical protein
MAHRRPIARGAQPRTAIAAERLVEGLENVIDNLVQNTDRIRSRLYRMARASRLRPYHFVGQTVLY